METFSPLRESTLTFTVFDVDVEKGRLVLNYHEGLADTMTLIPNAYLDKHMLVMGVGKVIQRLLDQTLAPDCVVETMERRTPDTSPAVDSLADLGPGAALEQLRRIVLAMDYRTLSIQGPPGAGKTYTASRLIRDLLDRGHRVGVTANSHAASDNLLRAVMELYPDEGDRGHILKIGETAAAARPLTDRGAQRAERASKLDFDTLPDACLVGGTAWCFAHDNCDERFDYLFVDRRDSTRSPTSSR